MTQTEDVMQIAQKTPLALHRRIADERKMKCRVRVNSSIAGGLVLGVWCKTPDHSTEGAKHERLPRKRRRFGRQTTFDTSLLAGSVLLGNVLLGSVLLGCIIAPDEQTTYGDVMVSWSVEPGCPQGASADVVAFNQLTLESFTSDFDCSDKSGITTALPAGEYDIYVDIRTADLSTLLAQSLSAPATVNDQRVSVSLPSFPVGQAFFGLTWSVVDTNNNILTCAEVGAERVRLQFADTATPIYFECAPGDGITNALPLGRYTATVDLVDTVGTAIPNTDFPVETMQLSFGNELVELGAFQFVFE